MTHYILASHSMGLRRGLEEKLPCLKEVGGGRVFLEGADYKNGYYTYGEEELINFFLTRGAGRHPHELERNPLENRSDWLAEELGGGGKAVVELEHPEEAPDIIRKNYRRFQVVDVQG